jgi:cytochrome c oxidase assembly protein subunit 15
MPVPALSVTSDPGPWPRRLGLAAALATVPLVLFGGSVTTLGAGMAVDGWLIAEGHFLLVFPADKWFRDVGTFVEHTHRLFGVLVGLFMLGCVLATWLRDRRASARLSATVSLLAVCGQGLLGGLRVLENDPELAFVHGALAQAVFALLCVNAAVLSRAWREATTAEHGDVDARGLRTAATVALVVLFAQVVLGAWYRHGLRPSPVTGHEWRLALHGLGAVAVLAALAAVARRGSALRERGALPAPLDRWLTRLPALVLVQLLLGGLAWAGFRPGVIGPAEWTLSIAHVLGGGLLLANCALISAWARRVPVAEPGLSGAALGGVA